MRRTAMILVAATLVAAGCGGDEPSPGQAGPDPTPSPSPSDPASPSPSPSPTAEGTPTEATETPTPDDGTAMIDGPSTTGRSTQEPDRGRLAVTDVDVGAHGGFDRLVFELAGDGDAGWLIEYVDDPRSQGSGHEVEIDGEAVLRVALRHVAYPAEAPAEPYDGPERIEPDRTDAIVEVLQDTLYEGYQDFFVGLDEERPYRVERLSDPQRVVIDIETGG